jgi:KipI family sensor histidine kinase inhibitor
MMDAKLFPHLRFRLSGETALLVECGDGIDIAVNEKALTLTSLLRENPPTGVRAVVPAYRSFAVLYDPLLTEPEILKQKINLLENEQKDTVRLESNIVSIPVCYGGACGPDMESVSSHTGLTSEEIIAIHASGEYPIYMIGFTPGFCYLGGLDKRLQTPRRETPRIRIPAGSVGIAEMQTGMYPVESPGGWQIIGRTPLRLFAPERGNPFLYKAGDRIRFNPITIKEFEEMESCA